MFLFFFSVLYWENIGDAEDFFFSILSFTDMSFVCFVFPSFLFSLSFVTINIHIL